MNSIILACGCRVHEWEDERPYSPPVTLRGIRVLSTRECAEKHQDADLVRMIFKLIEAEHSKL